MSYIIFYDFKDPFERYRWRREARHFSSKTSAKKELKFLLADPNRFRDVTMVVATGGWK
jgi:hypothetical protein